jgi:TonB family protein
MRALFRLSSGATVFGLIAGWHGNAAAAEAGQAPPRAPLETSKPSSRLDASGLTKAPKLSVPATPKYPEAARARGLEAVVVLLLDIDNEGRVTSASVAEPSLHPGAGFEQAALEAARALEFEPAEANGRAVPVQISYRYVFTLPRSAPPPAEPPAGERAAAKEHSEQRAVATFSGRLQERGSGLALARAVISVSSEQRGKLVELEATTDERGTFRFSNLSPAVWTVTIDAVGYQPFRTTEQLSSGEAVEAVYHLEPAPENPFDVTVIGAHPRKEVSRTTLAVAEVEQVPGVAGDPLAVVQNLPGVARSPFASGQVIVRGAAPEDTRVFIDGLEAPLIYHFGGIRSVVPMPLLGSIDFYPGNFGVQYGRATGGIVDVSLKPLEPESFGGSIDVSIFDASVYLEAPLGEKAALAVAARRSYIGEVLGAVLSDDAFNLTVAPRYYDYHLLGSYRPTPDHQLTAQLLGSDDRLEILFESPADLDPALSGNRLTSGERFLRASLAYRFSPSESFENVLRFAYGRAVEDDAFGDLAVNIRTDSLQVRDGVRQALDRRVTLAYGVDVAMTHLDGFVRGPGLPKEGEPQVFELEASTSSRISGDYFSPAAYLEAELSPFASWLIVPGVRVDHFGGTDQTVAQPRLTTRLNITRDFVAKAGAGLFAQEPTLDEIDAGFGNPKLGAERALHVSTGVEYRLLPHLGIDTTVFYKRLWDLVSRTDTFAPDSGGARPLRFDNGGRGTIYGAEVLLRHDFANRFSGWLSYTLSRSLRQDSGASTERVFDFDQTHVLTALGTYALPRNWSVGARFRLVSGNPRTPVVASTFNADADRYDPIYGATNSERNAPFHQLDLRVDKRWLFTAWSLNAYLEVQNAYNRANPEGLSYNYNYRASTQASGLPLLPILGLRADF